MTVQRLFVKSAGVQGRFFLLLAATLSVVLFSVGCGTNGNMQNQQAFSGTTNVTVLLSSTANDQLSEFGLVFQNITLTSQSGKAIPLFSGKQGAEFITVNGGALPFFTVSVPQGVYTGANITLGSAQFTCETLEPSSAPTPGGLLNSTFAYGQVPTNAVTANLPAPITITGKSMGLALNLQVSQSATFSGCYNAGIATYTITPTFTVAPVTFASQPTNATNGKVFGITGQVTAINATNNSFTLTEPVNGLTCPCPGVNTLSFAINNSTAFQGIANSTALTLGMFVDMDGVIQSDGSVLAQRIAAYDPSSVNVLTGPVLFVGSTSSAFYNLGRQQQGQDYSVQPFSLGFYNFPNASFQVSGQFNNLGSLPFVPNFAASTMVPGQNVSIFSQRIIASGGGGHYTPATTITLMPQVINGTITSSTQAGNFTDYTVSLASYDLFPTLAVQPGQTTLLTSPSSVDIYVDSSTQRLNTQALALGNTLRFYGLVFNDNGTLRMDCSQVNDGVTTSSQASSSARADAGQSKIVLSNFGSVQQMVITRTTR